MLANEFQAQTLRINNAKCFITTLKGRQANRARTGTERGGETKGETEGEAEGEEEGEAE